MLLVDDDEMFREALGELLRADGHEVLSVGSVEDVPSFDRLVEVGLVITDYRLPGQTGIALADALHRSHPMIPILLVTAHPAAIVEAEVSRRDYIQFVAKPVNYDDLHALVHDLVESRDRDAR